MGIKTFKVVKSRPNDNRAENKQYAHESPGNDVLNTYKKYVLAVAMEVVVASNIRRPFVSSILNGNSLPANCKARVVTNPYAIIPIKGRGTPDKYKIINNFTSHLCIYSLIYRRRDDRHRLAISDEITDVCYISQKTRHNSSLLLFI